MNEENNENTSFQDESPADKGLNRFLQDLKEKGPEFGKKVIQKKINEDSGEVYSRNLMDDDFQSEEDFEEDFDPDNDDDFVVNE